MDTKIIRCNLKKNVSQLIEAATAYLYNTRAPKMYCIILYHIIVFIIITLSFIIVVHIKLPSINSRVQFICYLTQTHTRLRSSHNLHMALCLTHIPNIVLLKNIPTWLFMKLYRQVGRHCIILYSLMRRLHVIKQQLRTYILYTH